MINQGDIVSFKNDSGGGKVLEVYPDNRALVLRDDGFEEVMPTKELVIPQVSYEEMGEAILHHNFDRIIEQKEGLKTPKKEGRPSKYTESYEVDLHIDAIMERFRHLSNGEILQIQLDHARRKLEKAILNKQRNIIFIHGIGEGVLRSELNKMLSEYPGLKSFDASYRKYGFGATEVLL